MTALLEIDLGAIADNWRLLDSMHPGATAGVVKADAYGLGAVQVAPALLAAGCRHFFTATFAEAYAIRACVPGAMLAVLNGVQAGEVAEFSAQDIIPVLATLEQLATWRAQAIRLGRALPAILQIDTGMSRLGLSMADAELVRLEPARLEGLRLDYILSHLASPEQPQNPQNATQAARFARVMQGFPGIKTSFANSSGMFLGPEFFSHLTRPGAALYGVNPTPGCANPMRPVVRLHAPILQIRDLKVGDPVGYNGIWTAQRPSRIAVLGFGYADGFMRALSNAAIARFDDAPVPLVGRVSMDLTNFDVTDVTAKTGDWLELLGPVHGVDALAAQAGTIGYEILTSLGRRYQRHYLGV